MEWRCLKDGVNDQLSCIKKKSLLMELIQGCLVVRGRGRERKKKWGRRAGGLLSGNVQGWVGGGAARSEMGFGTGDTMNVKFRRGNERLKTNLQHSMMS